MEDILKQYCSVPVADLAIGMEFKAVHPMCSTWNMCWHPSDRSMLG